jgi:hypothetical protein
MNKHLIKLADILDKAGLHKDVNVVDYLLGKSAQQDDFGEFASDVVYDKEASQGNVTIPTPDGEIQINLFSDPLASQIRAYCEKLAEIFIDDVSKRVGKSISVKEIDALADEFKKYNNDLSLSETSWHENSSLIHPQTIKNLVKNISSFVYHNSPFDISAEDYIDFVDHLHEIYTDFYTEDYLGANQGFDYKEHGRKMDEWRAENPDYMNEDAEALLYMHDAKKRKQLEKAKYSPSDTAEVMRSLQEDELPEDAPTTPYDG